MSKKALLSLVLIGVLALGLGIGSYAWFTSSATTSQNTFVTGTLEVGLNEDEELAFDLGAINMAPGDVTEETAIEITNEGSLNLAWFGKFILSGNEALTNAIYVEKMQMDFLNPEQGSWETTDLFIENGHGAGTYADYYEGFVDDNFDVITLKNLLENDNGMAPLSPGIQMGALKPGYKYRLTVQLGLPGLAGNDCQGKTAYLKYVVNATQIKAEALNKLFDDVDYLNGTGSNHLTWLNQQIDKQQIQPQ